MNQFKIILLLTLLFFAIPNKIYACTSSVTVITGCNRVNIGSGGYCRQTTTQQSKSCSGTTCSITYNAGNCGTWAAGCPLTSKINTITCGGGGTTPRPGGGTPTPGGGGGGGTNPQIGWYAPDGSPCNRTNYYAYYALSSCSGKAGFVTEGITPQSNCSNNGSGKCFLITGNAFTQSAKSVWKQDTQSCSPISSPTIPSNAFDTLYRCRFGLSPDSSINGSVTASFSSSTQFEKIFVWIVDSQVGWSQYYELPKSQIRSGQAISYNFDNLFSDKKYDVYVKAYGPGGVYLDSVVYVGSCGSPGCRSYPNVSFSFNLTFPPPLAGAVRGPGNQVTNQAFQNMIDLWIKGQITTRQMSQFIAQIGRVPGLQKATCDPKYPGGCNP